jgi:hypothetical protein
MGVDFSHGDAHFGHGSFHSFRKTLAAMVGVRLEKMQWFGGTTEWETISDPIAPPLWRNDAGDELTPEEAHAVADRLEELVMDEGNRERVAGDHGRTYWPG